MTALYDVRTYAPLVGWADTATAALSYGSQETEAPSAYWLHDSNKIITRHSYLKQAYLGEECN